MKGRGNLKLYVMGRKELAAVCLLFSAVALLFALNFENVAGWLKTSGGNRLLPIYRVRTEEKKVAISFDAAWGNEDTQQLIDIMEEYGVKATFFVVGEWVDKYPESVKALFDAGHEVMNHSNTHPHMPQISKEKMIEEIKLCSDKIEAVTGVRPNLFRQPYGDYDNKSLKTLEEQGYYTIQWDVDSLDWKKLSAAEITQRIFSRVRPGSIVLFHNAAINTPAALGDIIKGLLEKGYEFVKISELIYTSDYMIDHTGEQYKASPGRSG